MHFSIPVSFAGAFLLLNPIAFLNGEDRPVFSDLRLEGTILPDSFDVDITANTAFGPISSSGESEFEDAWRVGIVGHVASFNNNSFLSFASGGGVHYSHWYSGDVAGDATLEALAATLRIGLVIQPTTIFHLEAMPYGSLGAARGKIDNLKSDTSLYWEFGGIAGAYLTLSNVQFGIHGGYLWNGTELEYDANSISPLIDNISVDFRGEGAFIGASIGSRF